MYFLVFGSVILRFSLLSLLSPGYGRHGVHCFIVVDVWLQSDTQLMQELTGTARVQRYFGGFLQLVWTGDLESWTAFDKQKEIETNIFT